MMRRWMRAGGLLLQSATWDVLVWDVSGVYIRSAALMSPDIRGADYAAKEGKWL
jgi:hypothetical protein